MSPIKQAEVTFATHTVRMLRSLYRVSVRWLLDRKAERHPLAGRPLPYLEAKKLRLIDPAIEPLIDAMNASGVIDTVASCAGHGILPCTAPYVAFHCSIETAQSIARYLASTKSSEICKLKLHWELQASFDPFYCLVFVLRCPKENFTFRNIFSWRRIISHDILELESEIRQNIIFNHIGR